MCEHCRRNPCRLGCPNAPDPEIMGVCKYCGEKLRADYTYTVDNDGNTFCSQDCAVAYHEIKDEEWDDV